MVARRKRRTKYTWFPTLGTLDEDPINNWDGFEILAPVSPLAGVAILPIITPVLPDFKDELPDAQTDQLFTFLQNEYFLKRIVGKLFAVYIRTIASGATTPASVLVSAGFFIARAGSATGLAPIGAAADNAQDYGPLNPQTVTEPWIWRRSWLLGAYPATQGSGTPLPNNNAYIASNTQAGSVMDGPHIDAKTARRCGKDERLWLSVQTRNMDGTDVNVEGTVQLIFQARFLGAMRRSKNHSAF